MRSPLVALVQPAFQARIEAVAQTTVGPPLGLAYLASACERAGLRTTILDANAERLGPDEAATRLAALEPSVVGTTAVTPTIGIAARLAAAVKERAGRRVPVIVGGIHATVLPEETLASHRAFDYAVRGEGEEILPALVRRLIEGATPAGVPGVAWRGAGGEVRVEVGSGRIDSLDALPFPARHLLPNHLYRSPESLRFTSLIATRGCPAACTFCAVPILHGKRLRTRSPDSVVREMELCASRFAARFLSFLDDTFTMDRAWAMALAREIRSSLAVPRLRWICLTRADRVDPELLDALRSAGCVRVEMGIDAGDPGTARAVRKGIGREEVLSAFRACRRAGLSTMGFAIIGYPNETVESMRATLALVREADPDYLQLSFAVPYPGTAMREEAIAKGLLATGDWNRYVFFARPVMRNPGLAAHEIAAMARRFQASFYFRPRKIARLATLVVRDRLSPAAMAVTAWKATRHLVTRRRSP